MSDEGNNRFLFWTEYVSNNMDETSVFMQEMFGWQVWSRSEEDTYLMVDGKPVMNIVQWSSEMENDGVTPHIKNYIDVDDYDKYLKKAVEKGAELVHEAVVPDLCKLGVLRIPGDLLLAIVQYYKGQP